MTEHHYTIDGTPVTPDQRYYTLAEAARILNVHPKTLRKAIRSGIIPAVRVGPKAVRIPAEALRNLTDQEES